jgi:hypothetical protein
MAKPFFRFYELAGCPFQNPDPNEISEAAWTGICTRASAIASASRTFYAQACDQGREAPLWQTAALWWACFATVCASMGPATLREWLNRYCIGLFYAAILMCSYFPANYRGWERRTSGMKSVQVARYKSWAEGFQQDLACFQGTGLPTDEQWVKKARRFYPNPNTTLAGPSTEWPDFLAWVEARQ